MTFIFDSDTILTSTLTFNIPDGPGTVLLQLVSQVANESLAGAVADPVDAWSASAGLFLQRVGATPRYTEYRFAYAGDPGSLDDFSIIFTKDVKGIYNFRVLSLADDFIWNLNNFFYNEETRDWNWHSELGESQGETLVTGVISISNVQPYSPPARKTYESSNETRTGYTMLTNNSI